jgi:AAA domain
MASLSVNESFATKPKNSIGETYTRKVLSDWKGNHVADACIAATQIGLIHSSSLLGYERSKEILREEFDFRKVDDVNWSVVNEAFQNGRSAVISPTEIRKRFSFAVANDNKPKPTSGLAALNTIRERAGSTVADQIANRAKERFQITWFDDVDQSAAKEEILQGVLGAGEFSLFVAKPGTAKSVLVGDIGCHVAAGMDWHGRKVKQGLVVFYAAERKRLTERRVAAWRKKHDVTNIPFVVVGGKLDMTTGLIDAKTLAATIKGLEEKSGHKCVLIILDTVTRTFGPGDQHQSRDMQRYVQSVDELNRVLISPLSITCRGMTIEAKARSTWTALSTCRSWSTSLVPDLPRSSRYPARARTMAKTPTVRTPRIESAIGFPSCSKPTFQQTIPKRRLVCSRPKIGRQERNFWMRRLEAKNPPERR